MNPSKPILRITLVTLLLGTLLGGVYFFQSGRIQAWLHAEAVKAYVDKIQPHLPFVIESAEMSDLTHLALVLRSQTWRIRLNGELEAKEKDGLYLGGYAASTTIEPVGRPSEASTPFHLELQAGVAKTLTALQELRVEVAAEQFEWKLFSVKSRELHAEAEWQNGNLALELGLTGIELNEPNRSLNIAHLSLDADVALALKPLALGKKGTFQFETSGGEALMGNLYLDLPLSDLPLAGDFALADGKPRELKLYFGKPSGKTSGKPSEKRAPLSAVVLLDEKAHPTQIRWNSEPLVLARVIPPILKAAISTGGSLASLSKFTDVHIKEGTLSSSGEVSFDQTSHAPSAWWTSLRIANFGFDWDRLKLKARGLNLKIPHATIDAATGDLEIPKIAFRQIKAALKPLTFSLKHRAGVAGAQAYDFRLGQGANIPLEIEKIPLTLGTISGRIGGGTPTEPGFELGTELHLKSVPLALLLHAACLPHDHAPPAQVSGEFPEIKLTPGDIDPTGKFRIDFFKGQIEVSQIGAFDIASEVPEFDFSVDWSGIQLDQLGEWLNFGEMDGLLQGYARDVVFQAWLPTQFDFKLEVKPFRRAKVVFSPDAMKNVVRLFAADGIDQIPGIANWMAFGWPSRIFGGYDVQYAGISLFSNDGMILVETLDPEALQSKGRKHYIIYGPRFRMPLESSHYPLVMDAPSMGNFVRQLSIQLGKMAEAKKLKTGKKGEPIHAPEQADHDEDDCRPSEI